MTINTILIITFILYFLLVFYIGWRAYRKTKNLADYILGGRRLGRWTTALSAGASDMSGWLLLGLPGYAYIAGLEAIWIALGLLIGTYLNWLFVAPKLRIKSEALNNALTLPEYFEHHFNDNTHVLRFITAFFILLFFLFYTSSGLVAGGKLFESVFGMPYQWAVIAGTLTILAYTVLGGFLAVSWTDLFQGLLMALALTIAAVYTIQELGGIQLALESTRGNNIELLNPLTHSNSEPLTLIAWLSLVGWGLGYFGQPHILVRFMAIKSPALIKDARRIAVIWTFISMVAAISIGLAGITFLDMPLSSADSEKVFMEIVQLLFHPVIAGICLAAILAAIMSTADSQLLVASSAITEDFYKILLKREVRDNELIWIGRLSVVVIALIACLLAMDPGSMVLELVSYAWAGFGATFGPVIILTLYFKRISYNSVIVGILTGSLTVIVWKQLSGGIFDLYELVPGFILSSTAIIVTALCAKSHKNQTNNNNI